MLLGEGSCVGTQVTSIVTRPIFPLLAEEGNRGARREPSL